MCRKNKSCRKLCCAAVMQTFDIGALVESNLHGWAKVRLQKLDNDQLDKIAVEMGAAARSTDSLKGKVSVIESILERKRERAKARPRSPLGAGGGMGEEDAALLLQSKIKEKYRGVFVSRHQLKIMSFNSLKLRTERVGLKEQWVAFAAMMGEFDVVMMSEVPAKQAKERAHTLLKIIQSCFSSEDENLVPSWSLHLSEPSGPGNLEVHVAFVRSPLSVLKVQTLSRVEGLQMDHAPFQIVVQDERFNLSKRVVLTHVHMPPSSRANDRDTQLRLLLRSYPLHSSLRLDLPFDPKAAKERKMDEVTHIVCGDFNVYPSKDEYQLESNGWADPLIPERVSTSSGGKAYDNFIIDKHAAKRLSTFSDVMELAVAQNSTSGTIGISDHDPVVLTLKELPLVGRRSSRKVCLPYQHVHTCHSNRHTK